MQWGYDSAPGDEPKDNSQPRDYSEAKDYSQPADYSKPADNSQFLGKAEKEAQGSEKGSGKIKDNKELAKMERWLYGKSPQSTETNKSKTQGKARFSGRIKRRIGLSLGGALLVGSAGIFGPGMLGTTGILKFYEMLNGHFNIGIESISSRRANKVIAKQINSSNRTPSAGALCSVPGKIGCRYKDMSNRAIKNLERRTGIRVITANRASLPGKSPVAGLWMPDGKILSAVDFDRLLKNGDPELRRMMRQAMKPRVAVWAGKATKALFTKLKIDKAGGFIKERTVDKARDKIKARQKGSTANVNTKPIPLSGDADADAGANRQNSAAQNFKENVLGKQLGFDLDKNVTSAAARGAIRGAAKGVTAGVGIIGTADIACTVLNIIAAMGYISKAIGAEQLIAFTTTFLSSVDGLKAGKATTAGWHTAGELLFKVDPNTGQNAFQSFGYGMMSGNFWGDELDTMEFKLGGGFVGDLVDIKNQVINLVSPGNPDAVRDACGVIQNPFVRAGSLVVGVAAMFVPGVNAAQIAKVAVTVGIAIGLFAAISFLVPVVTRMLTGDLVGPDTMGGSAGNAMTSGMGALSGKSANSLGFTTMSRAEAISFDINIRQPYLAEVREDERLAANPWDITNPYSVVGSIAGGLFPYLSGVSWKSNLASLSSLAFNPFKVFSSSVSAQSAERYYEVCDDDDYRDLNIATDPFCNPVYGLPLSLAEADPDDVMLYMYNNGHIDDTGSPKSKSYKDFLENCVNNAAPIGFYNEELDDDDIMPQECIRGGGKFAYDEMFFIYTIDDSVYQMMQCILDEVGEACYSDGMSSGGGSGAQSAGHIGDGELSLPVKLGTPMTSQFGWRTLDGVANLHSGLDFGGALNDPIYAAGAGKVTAANNGCASTPNDGCGGGYGNYVYIEHSDKINGNTIVTRYAHGAQGSVSVSVGDTVVVGQEIMKMANSGWSRGVHLHFEVHVNSTPVDPRSYLGL
ncbi:MAG: M23 family metallopeptidase [Coriobacteriia bacterium]|nr:M23 family metallopeptidase [Coriobacteriia bacterium]